MRIIIEFCRSRSRDRALAVIDRVYCDALNVEAAKGMSLTLAKSREMPQAPDFVRILDEDGMEFFREAIAPGAARLTSWPVDLIGGDFDR